MIMQIVDTHLAKYLSLSSANETHFSMFYRSLTAFIMDFQNIKRELMLFKFSSVEIAPPRPSFTQNYLEL